MYPDFLKDPLTYLDNHVISDTGVTFGAHKPDPRMIGQMFRIQYDELVRLISTSQAKLLNVDLYTFEPTECEIILSEAGKEQIRERAKFYLSDEREISEYNKLSAIADTLNDLCIQYNLHGPDINVIARSMPFLATVSGGRSRLEAGTQCFFHPQSRGKSLSYNHSNNLKSNTMETQKSQNLTKDEGNKIIDQYFDRMEKDIIPLVKQMVPMNTLKLLTADAIMLEFEQETKYRRHLILPRVHP